MNWVNFSQENPELPFAILVTDGKHMTLEYGPCQAQQIVNAHGFFPTHWIYVRDVDMPEDTL